MFIFDQLRKNDPQLRALMWGIMAGMGALLLGLYWVQVISSRHFVADQKAQSFRTVRIPAIRGKILDRERRPLADNKPTYNVCLYLDELRSQFTYQYTNSVLPEFRRTNGLLRGKIPYKLLPELKKAARYRAASNIVQHLSTIVQEPVVLAPETFHDHYQNTLALPLPVLVNLSPIQLARFQEHPNTTAGVDLEVQPTRSYPLGATASHLVGYLVRDNRSTVGEDAFVNYRLPDYSGIVGIEWAFDQTLRGRGGVKSVLVNSLGYRQAENIWTPAEPGKNVVLTLDLEVQQAAERALASVGPGTKGAVVVMNPNTGDVLALVSAPGLDPNSFIPRIDSQENQQMQDPERRPMVNRAIQEHYFPGSIFKIITGLACLEAGMDPNVELYVPGYIFVGRRRIEDRQAPGGFYNFRRAFLKSSNAYFISNGLNCGIQQLVRLGQKFHLGEATGIPTRQEVAGRFPSLERVRKHWYDGDTANLCIGQGPIDVTPMQMAVMVAAIANGGKVLWPRLVARIEPQSSGSESEVIEFANSRVRDELGVQPKNLQIVREAMLADVEDLNGTGHTAFVANLRVCGKTGTAQVTDPRGQVIDHTVWFASYAPYEHPRYAVIVMVESGTGGGTTCGPVAQKIYQFLANRDEQRQTNSPPPSVARIQ